MADPFAVIAEPTRRRILDLLRQGEASVTDLVGLLGLPQPAVSKHLRVLREHGLVVVRVAAQRRIYAIDPRPLGEIDNWLAAFRQTWNRRVDALSDYLDETAATDNDSIRRPT
jgi:DNA-binding transcriptional ArsR family regulator